jgi:plasmid stabilization system protein ParE
MRELVFLLSADIDIQKAYEHYEDWQEGRGALFMRHLDVAFTQLRAFPEIAPVFHGSYRRLLVPRFPYGIFYTLESGRIIIGAVIYLRQDPEAIRGRLDGQDG